MPTARAFSYNRESLRTSVGLRKPGTGCRYYRRHPQHRSSDVGEGGADTKREYQPPRAKGSSFPARTQKGSPGTS